MSTAHFSKPLPASNSVTSLLRNFRSRIAARSIGPHIFANLLCDWMLRSHRLLADRERALGERFRLGIPHLITVQHGEVAEADGAVRMVRSQHLIANRERAFEERFGLGIAALSLVQRGQIVEARGDLWMLRAGDSFPDVPGFG